MEVNEELEVIEQNYEYQELLREIKRVKTNRHPLESRLVNPQVNPLLKTRQKE